MSKQEISFSTLSQNRTEEIGYDVWSRFVVPTFYDRLNLHLSSKPSVIIGGRGCGKTMLLRYVSHQSMFSKSRPFIPDETIKNIGLYWRADTQFSNAMTKRDIADDVWQAAFNHMAAVILASEVLDSLRSIANSKCRLITPRDLKRLDFQGLQAFDTTLPRSEVDLRKELERRVWSFEAWVNDVRKTQEPHFLPGKQFVLGLIKEVKSQIAVLSDSTFSVYIDEYENLREYQQQILNTWLKHSEPPLMFNLAMKRYGWGTKSTLGPESVSDVHDFRTHDVEEYLLEEDFSVFAAEILFLTMDNMGIQNLPISPKDLRDPSKVSDRRSQPYVKRVLDAAQTYFPDVPQEELAKAVFDDSSLTQKNKSRIAAALRNRRSTIAPDAFIRKTAPQASVIIPALLYRKNLSPEEVLSELDKLENGSSNRFTGKTNWIHNNFIGCLLQLYEPYSRACPFYAGFSTFCHLSNGNIRHFLELCNKSINRAARQGVSLGQTVIPGIQAEAARQASAAFLGEIRSFGKHGNKLYTFVLRLGSLFALAHQRPSQSESEQSHFSIVGGPDDLRGADLDFLREAIKWSVLFETKGTKKKDVFDPESPDYVLNPIYAPYFHISYRKKRKLELSPKDVLCLMAGSYDQVKNLLKRYSEIWEVEPVALSPTLFSHLELTDTV